MLDELTPPGFDTHNTLISVEGKGWNVTAYVDNLFDEFGETGVRGTPLFDQAVSDINGDPVYTRTFGTFVSPPQRIGLRVRKKF